MAAGVERRWVSRSTCKGELKGKPLEKARRYNMLKEALTRRQFVGGTAAIAGAAALPTLTHVSKAFAENPLISAWPNDLATNPLDATAAARLAIEIYRGKHAGQGG
jgi:hypothetical protein